MWKTAKYVTQAGDVLLFEDYQVNERAEVRNRKTNKLITARRYTGGKDGTTYENVNLYHHKLGRKTVKVHRLVISSFNTVPCSEIVASHRDDNPKNNHLDNIEWATSAFNSYRMVQNAH